MSEEGTKASKEPTRFKLIVGLGNPGSQYDGTRHNIGFAILDETARDLSLDWKEERKWQGWVGKSQGAYFLKPNTFMNLSGRSVGTLARFFRWKAQEILVVYDDVDLPLGRLRFRAGGGHGGHNGIRSMIDSLGTSDFARLKVGVGGAAPSRGEGLVGHVLGKFAPDEKEEAQKILATAAKAVQVALSEGFAVAANHFNLQPKKKNPPTPQKEDESQI